MNIQKSIVFKKNKLYDEDYNLSEGQLEEFYQQETEWKEKMKHIDMNTIFDQLNKIVPKEIDINADTLRFNYLIKKHLI